MANRDPIEASVESCVREFRKAFGRNVSELKLSPADSGEVAVQCFLRDAQYPVALSVRLQDAR